MRGLAVGSMVLAALTMPTGCSECDATVDCIPVTEFEGTTYGSLGYTELDGVPVGTGEQSGCEDVCGADESGEVEVYELDGFSTEQVIGVLNSGGTLSTAVSVDLSERDRLRIRRQLDRAEQ